MARFRFMRIELRAEFVKVETNVMQRSEVKRPFTLAIATKASITRSIHGHRLLFLGSSKGKAESQFKSSR